MFFTYVCSYLLQDKRMREAGDMCIEFKIDGAQNFSRMYVPFSFFSSFSRGLTNKTLVLLARTQISHFAVCDKNKKKQKSFSGRGKGTFYQRRRFGDPQEKDRCSVTASDINMDNITAELGQRAPVQSRAQSRPHHRQWRPR